MVVTTPDTSAVRAWARSNGYDVADRGRLPAELTDAYLAAQGGKAAPAKKAAGKKAAGKKAITKPAAARKAPARAAKAAPKTAPKPVAKTAPKPTAKAAAPAAAAAVAEAPGSAAASSAPVSAQTAEPKPKPVSDDRRLVALGEQLTALTARVAELEKAVGSKPAGNGVAKRFRRSR